MAEKKPTYEQLGAENQELKNQLISLQEKEDLSRVILNSIGDAVITIDAHGFIMFMNPVAEQLTGWSEHNAKNKKLTEVFEIVNTISREVVANPVTEVLESGDIEMMAKNTILISDNGKEFQIADSAAPIKNNVDKIIGVVLVFRDVSEEYRMQVKLKQSEEKFRSLFKDHSAVKLIIDPDSGDIVEANKAAARFYGWSVEALEQMNIAQINTLPFDKIKEEMEQARQGSKTNFEFKHRKADGSISDVELFGSRVKIGDKAYIHSIVYDISEKKQIFEDLKAAKEKAEESDRLKTAFLANMSHEIRTPMNGILGFTDVLRESDLTSEEKNKYIEIIHKSGQRLMNTVNDIVEMSKIEAGIITTEWQETNLNHSLEDMVSFFSPEAKEKGLELKLDQLLPEYQSAIITDKNKFEAILSNLIKNSIKYTDEGYINVGISRKAGDIEFYVKDTGIGIPENRQAAIFNRFEQADISDKRAFEGSGLGMAISKSYIALLGGELWLESEENKGSVFYFNLPIKEAKKTKQAGTSNEAIESGVQSNTEIPDKKLKVLVAEDDNESFMYLSTILKKYNWNIIHAITGRQTIEKYREQPDTDLILMDIKLPDIDGYEATRSIKKLNPNVPVIAQTAYALEGDRQKAMEAGCDEYISKPIKKTQLLQMIQNVVRA